MKDAAGMVTAGVLPVDTHAHLDMEQFDSSRDRLLSQLLQKRISGVICPGISADSSEKVAAIAVRWSGCYAAVGIHPNYCAEAAREDWNQICRLAEQREVVAIGETGLDKYWDFAPLAKQRDWLIRHVELSQRLGKPLIIHCRDAEDELLAILSQVASAPINGVMHAFSGDVSFLEECLSLGLYISFAGSVTYRNRKFEKLRDSARKVPAERLLVETDSPFLVPEPLRGKEKCNRPDNVWHTIRFLAELRGTTAEQLVESTATNAVQLFRLEDVRHS